MNDEPRKGKRARRSIALRGLVVATERQGQMQWQSWPKNGPPKTEKVLKARDIFRQMAVAAKYMDPQDRATVEIIARNGTLLPRDWQFMLLRGRAFNWPDQHGNRWYPMNGYTDLSIVLDAISSEPGTILVRGPDFWVAVPPGPLGSYLRANGPTAAPDWGPGTQQAAASSRINVGTPPSASSASPLYPTWLSVAWDDANVWSAANPRRITVPAGGNRMRLTAAVELDTNNQDGNIILQWEANGGGVSYPPIGRQIFAKQNTGFQTQAYIIVSGWFPVTPGQYYELAIYRNPTWSSSITATSYVVAEVI